MTKLKKRATALLLGSVTFFMALAMPYNTTRVYAADVAFSWVVNESSNTILNWILLYLGISVAPEVISEGKVFDKTGQFAMDFCNISIHAPTRGATAILHKKFVYFYTIPTINI